MCNSKASCPPTISDRAKKRKSEEGHQDTTVVTTLKALQASAGKTEEIVDTTTFPGFFTILKLYGRVA